MKNTLMNLSVIAGLVLSAPTFGAEKGMANEAIVGDSSGRVVTDGFGDCVGTSSWSRDLADEACGDVIEQAAPAPAPEPVVAYAPQVVSEEITLSSAALFGFDSADFKREQPQLDALAERVKALASIESVNIVGHTDSVGAESYNQALSERRAEAVKQFLIGRGVDAGIIHATGKGEFEPVADNNTEEGRAQNRRVEIRFQGTETR
ncbi:MAG: OmpA family protein [Thiogranum sp.]|nr:OmpA family protein [Thiogranum sp.]